MSIEAMKQALEALELVIGDIEWQEFSPTRKFCRKAITALHTAIEQAEKQERNFCERCGKRLGGKDHIHTCTPPIVQRAKEAFKSAKKREWVGLTDEDMTELDEDGVVFARYIEAKLREKNT